MSLANGSFYLSIFEDEFDLSMHFLTNLMINKCIRYMF